MPDHTGFFVVGGTLGGNVNSYVKRPLDDELLQLTLEGEYCNVLAARQMGKSSLMVRTAQKLREHGVRPIIIDITAIGSSISASEWYFGLLSRLARDLKLDIDEQEWWRAIEEKSPMQRFSDFLRDVMLERVHEPIVIFIDEIDSTLKLDFTDDFFAAIRSIFNARSRDDAYKRLTFVLLGVARPGDLIKDRTRTPYNIGVNVEVTDFQLDELGAFQQVLGDAFPNNGEQVLRWVLDWTGGQPYLTQKLCAELVEDSQGVPHEGDVANLVKHIFLNDQARTETNLRAIRDRIQTSPHLLEMLATYKRVLAGKKVAAEERSIAQNELKLTGLVKVSTQDTLQIRNRIYGHVFNADWVKHSIPASVTNRRLILVISSIAVVSLALAGFLYYRQFNQAIEVQAQTYVDTFNASSSQEVRITNLAGLFRLGGEYEGWAREIFMSLPYEEKILLFNLTTPDNVGSELVVVADGVYQTVENSADGNALLLGMSNALEGTTASGSVGLVIEITAWVDGREALIQRQYEVAVASLTTAWDRSEQRENPNLSTLLDRAQAYTALEQYDNALKDLDQVLSKNSEYTEAVNIFLTDNSNQALLDHLRANRGQFPNVEQVVSSPSTTATVSVPATPKLPSEITDEHGVSMVLVPAGEFIMGDTAEHGFEECIRSNILNANKCELKDFLNQEPVHTVYLDNYWMDKTEVTNGQYKRCVKAGVCSMSSSSEYYLDDRYDNYPVVFVTWVNANIYCTWAGKRLPTEAEWEKAARGTDGRTYPWGEELGYQYANYNSSPGDVTQVGSYELGRSPYGIYDMAGNVKEWVADLYDSEYYKTLDQPSINPQGPLTGDGHVIRGGGFLYHEIQSARREYGNLPGRVENVIGFRCAMDAP